MFSYSVLIQKNFEVVKILYTIINALGASFYDLNKPEFKYFSILYSSMVLLLYITQILLSIYIFPKLNFSAPFVAFCVFKLCETTVPILFIVQSFYSGRAFLKSCIDDVIFTDKLLHISGIGIDYLKMKQRVKLTFIGTTVYVSFVLGTSFLFFINFSKTFSVLVTIVLCILEISHVLYNIYLNYFFCLVLIIFKQRFEKLNEQVRLLVGTKLEEGASVITVKPYNPESSSLEKIKTVKFVHAIYRQIVLDHNNRFGFVILLQFIQVGTVLILCVYFLLNIKAIEDSIMISLVVVTILRCTALILSTIISCVITSSEVFTYIYVNFLLISTVYDYSRSPEN